MDSLPHGIHQPAKTEAATAFATDPRQHRHLSLQPQPSTGLIVMRAKNEHIDKEGNNRRMNRAYMPDLLSPQSIRRQMHISCGASRLCFLVFFFTGVKIS
jgi:hypothetical protein